MRISDWSSDVCSSDLVDEYLAKVPVGILAGPQVKPVAANRRLLRVAPTAGRQAEPVAKRHRLITGRRRRRNRIRRQGKIQRSEEHTSELQSLMRISYAVFCLKKKNTKTYQALTKMNNN